MPFFEQNASTNLTLGVTGHRILSDLNAIRSGIRHALHHIEQVFPGRALMIVSSLAEGADRIVATEVLQRTGAKLEAILPMPREEYVHDFRAPASLREFESLLVRADSTVELPLRSPRAASYEAAGMAVLDRSQILIAVWDGKAEQGRGGTGRIVTLARSRHLPIAWIHAGNRNPGTQEATTLGDSQGVTTFENF